MAQHFRVTIDSSAATGLQPTDFKFTLGGVEVGHGYQGQDFAGVANTPGIPLVYDMFTTVETASFDGFSVKVGGQVTSLVLEIDPGNGTYFTAYEAPIAFDGTDWVSVTAHNSVFNLNAALGVGAVASPVAINAVYEYVNNTTGVAVFKVTTAELSQIQVHIQDSTGTDVGANGCTLQFFDALGEVVPQGTSVGGSGINMSNGWTVGRVNAGDYYVRTTCTAQIPAFRVRISDQMHDTPEAIAAFPLVAMDSAAVVNPPSSPTSAPTPAPTSAPTPAPTSAPTSFPAAGTVPANLTSTFGTTIASVVPINRVFEYYHNTSGWVGFAVTTTDTARLQVFVENSAGYLVGTTNGSYRFFDSTGAELPNVDFTGDSGNLVSSCKTTDSVAPGLYYVLVFVGSRAPAFRLRLSDTLNDTFGGTAPLTVVQMEDPSIFVSDDNHRSAVVAGSGDYAWHLNQGVNIKFRINVSAAPNLYSQIPFLSAGDSWSIWGTTTDRATYQFSFFAYTDAGGGQNTQIGLATGVPMDPSSDLDIEFSPMGAFANGVLVGGSSMMWVLDMVNPLVTSMDPVDLVVGASYVYDGTISNIAVNASSEFAYGLGVLLFGRASSATPGLYSLMITAENTRTAASKLAVSAPLDAYMANVASAHSHELTRINTAVGELRSRLDAIAIPVIPAGTYVFAPGDKAEVLLGDNPDYAWTPDHPVRIEFTFNISSEAPYSGYYYGYTTILSYGRDHNTARNWSIILSRQWWGVGIQVQDESTQSSYGLRSIQEGPQLNTNYHVVIEGGVITVNGVVTGQYDAQWFSLGYAYSGGQLRVGGAGYGSYEFEGTVSGISVTPDVEFLARVAQEAADKAARLAANEAAVMVPFNLGSSADYEWHVARPLAISCKFTMTAPPMINPDIGFVYAANNLLRYTPDITNGNSDNWYVSVMGPAMADWSADGLHGQAPAYSLLILVEDSIAGRSNGYVCNISDAIQIGVEYTLVVEGGNISLNGSVVGTYSYSSWGRYAAASAGSSLVVGGRSFGDGSFGSNGGEGFAGSISNVVVAPDSAWIEARAALWAQPLDVIAAVNAETAMWWSNQQQSGEGVTVVSPIVGEIIHMTRNVWADIPAIPAGSIAVCAIDLSVVTGAEIGLPIAVMADSYTENPDEAVYVDGYMRDLSNNPSNIVWYDDGTGEMSNVYNDWGEMIVLGTSGMVGVGSLNDVVYLLVYPYNQGVESKPVKLRWCVTNAAGMGGNSSATGATDTTVLDAQIAVLQSNITSLLADKALAIASATAALEAKAAAEASVVSAVAAAQAAQAAVDAGILAGISQADAAALADALEAAGAAQASAQASLALAQAAQASADAQIANAAASVRSAQDQLAFALASNVTAQSQITALEAQLRDAQLAANNNGGTPTDYSVYVAAVSITKAARQALTDAYQPGSGVSSEMLNGLIAAYQGAINAERASRDVVLGGMETALKFGLGDKSIPGRLFSGTAGVSRVVRLYDQDSGEMVDTTISDADGHFMFTEVVSGDYFMTAHDFSGLAGEKTSSVIENISA